MPKRVGFLYDKMLDRAFIREAILRAAKHKTKRRSVRRVLRNLDGYTEKTYALLATGDFKPSRPREREIYDESSQKWRMIQVVPFWPDNVIHWMLVLAMQPVLMRGMYHWSCASIPGRGGHRTKTHIERTMRRDTAGTLYAAELDIRHYYPNVSVARLMRALRHKIKDERFLRLVERVLRSCGRGLAIGFYICQWLANFFLEPLDRMICALDGVKYYDRYMDNMTLRGPNKKKLHRARKAIEVFLRKMGLQLKGNWQIYRTRMKREAAVRHAMLDDRKRRLRRPRMVAAVGFRYSYKHTLLRKRNALRLMRQCRKIRARMQAGRPVTHRQAAGLLSRIGQLRHCDSHTIKTKYVDPIKVRYLKEVVRNESTRRQQSGQLLDQSAA